MSVEAVELVLTGIHDSLRMSNWYNLSMMIVMLSANLSIGDIKNEMVKLNANLASLQQTQTRLPVSSLPLPITANKNTSTPDKQNTPMA